MSTLQELFGLQGRTALVTGASSGLGVEFAHGLAEAGADVALLARRRDRVEAVAESVRAHGAQCLALQGDVTDEAQVDAALERITEELGGLDILVNNAGVAPFGRAEKHTAEQWREALEVNVTAAFRLSQKVLPLMEQRGGGRIVNVSSVLGSVANSVFPTVAYGTSKGAVEMMTRQLAVEWAPRGITVNCVAPGWFPTEMNTDPRYGDVHPKYKEKMIECLPMGRLGETGELKGALIYLASPAGRYVTGTTLVVDGGWLAW